MPPASLFKKVKMIVVGLRNALLTCRLEGVMCTFVFCFFVFFGLSSCILAHHLLSFSLFPLHLLICSRSPCRVISAAQPDPVREGEHLASLNARISHFTANCLTQQHSESLRRLRHVRCFSHRFCVCSLGRWVCLYVVCVCPSVLTVCSHSNWRTRAVRCASLASCCWHCGWTD